MAEIFRQRRELGRLFSENVYRQALKATLNNIETEVEIKVSLHGFCKSYFIDIVASSGALFELKAVESLHQRHRKQLLHYLFLTGLKHGKLVNVRPEIVEHEFINTSLTNAARRAFSIQDSEWTASQGFGPPEKALMIEIVADWGIGLERTLYEEALFHFLGIGENSTSNVDVILDGQIITSQPTALCSPGTALKITAFEDNTAVYESALTQFLSKTSLGTIQ